MVKGMRAYDEKKRRQIRRQNHKTLDIRFKPVKSTRPPVPDDWKKQNWRINDEDGID